MGGNRLKNWERVVLACGGKRTRYNGDCGWHNDGKKLAALLAAGGVSKAHYRGGLLCVKPRLWAGILPGRRGLAENSRYYIASVDKLFISALVQKCEAEGRLQITDKLGAYLPGEWLTGLHVYRGVDYSGELTLTHLLAHTSGLPCYLADKQAGGKRIMEELEAGVDQAWRTDQVVAAVKRMPAHFIPGTQKRLTTAIPTIDCWVRCWRQRSEKR